MAATLPPINSKNGTNKVPSYAENVPQGPQSAKRKPLEGGSKKKRELQEKRMQLRALQHDLTKTETAVYRNTYRHTLCLDMLKEGFHLSFRELFHLIHRQLAERLRRGPESLMWTQIMLEDEHDKLDMIRKYLTVAETAQRNDDYQEVYTNRYELACYFQRTGDKWLADHFFQTCLEMSESIVSDGGKTKGGGQCNVGLTCEENGQYFEAAQHYEEYYKLAIEHKDDWTKTDADGHTVSFYSDACMCLYRIYTTIAKQLEEEEDAEQSLAYLIKAFDKAQESNDVKLSGEAAYKLGLAYEKSGDTETALLHLDNFYAICEQCDDKEGLGRACDAIAKTYARQGRKQESIEYLMQFVQMAEECGMDEELSLACHNLGNIFNSLGRYKEAGEYFNRAYNISRAMGEGPSISINRVQSGIAQAHAMLRPFASHVVRGDPLCLARIIEWKSVRQSYFHEPLPHPPPRRRSAVVSTGRVSGPPKLLSKKNANQSADDETSKTEADDAPEVEPEPTAEKTGENQE